MAETTVKHIAASVTVATTARLHFGFFDPSGKSPQPFGSFGLSIDRPLTRLTLHHANEEAVSGPEAARAHRYLKRIAESSDSPCTFRLDVQEAIPAHAGLGSGTQLALAVGTAFAKTVGLALPPIEIAKRLGRGIRSGIGIATFEAGGAVLDSGPREDDPPSLVARVPFPGDWRVLLIFDPGSKGLAGAGEAEAFGALPTFPEAERADLQTRIAKHALPALEHEDFAAFCAEVGHLQQCMGTYFAPLQGGPYTSSHVARVLEGLGAEGITGLGQTSWGPTGFAFASSEAESRSLLKVARKYDASSVLHFEISQGRNRGAEIAVSEAERA